MAKCDEMNQMNATSLLFNVPHSLVNLFLFMRLSFWGVCSATSAAVGSLVSYSANKE